MSAAVAADAGRTGPQVLGQREPRPELLAVEDLTVHYGAIQALRGVSLTIGRGEVVALIGANGAGKTSTLRAVSGMLKPSGGRVRFDGHDTTGARAHTLVPRGMAHAPEGRGIFPNLTVLENLEHFARMLGVGQSEIERVAKLVTLDHRLDQRVGTYSLGMRQRLGIAQAMLGEPRLLILDEPANGLDPAGIREIRELLRHLARDRPMSVFVSSHLLAEVQLMCDRVAIIHRGELLREGPVAELAAGGSLEDMFLQITGGETVD